MDKKEIGGYFGFEKYNGKMLYENGLKFNLARNCLAYLIKAKNIKEIYVPYFCCLTVSDACKKSGVKINYYNVGYDFKPVLNKDINKNGSWLYLVNYFGQIPNSYIKKLSKKNNVIVDNIQAYFQKPINGLDTMYSCRKFFGVTDGAILFTDEKSGDDYPIDITSDRVLYMVGRFEDCANNYHEAYKDLGVKFRDEGIKIMSKFTENLLHSFDYKDIKRARTNNYSYLLKKLKSFNKLNLRKVDGAFMYPLKIDGAAELRQELINDKIYVPILWANNELDPKKQKIEWELTYGTVLLPCDQRYSKEDMQRIVDKVYKFVGKNNIK